MSCRYQNFDDGKCQVFEPGIEQNGCNDEGNYTCSDDEDPSYMCEDWEEC